jgi:hypothetical protein
MRTGGFVVVPDLLTSSGLAQLRHEAAQQRAIAQHVFTARSDKEQHRGGDPARKYLSAPGGAFQRAIYNAPATLQYLTAIAGLPLSATGGYGTFTYYCRPGDYLTVHRDVSQCDLALITCIEDSGGEGSGGKVCLYPERIHEPLSEIRRRPALGAVTMRLAPGDSLVLLGGIVPHCTIPVGEQQTRIVSLLCYCAAVG